MSDTPRTDAELMEVNESEADNPRVEPSENGTLVNACFARQLERELSAANDSNARLWKALDVLIPRDKTGKIPGWEKSIACEERKRALAVLAGKDVP